jgi:hypothetical protein
VVPSGKSFSSEEVGGYPLVAARPTNEPSRWFTGTRLPRPEMVLALVDFALGYGEERPLSSWVSGLDPPMCGRCVCSQFDRWVINVGDLSTTSLLDQIGGRVPRVLAKDLPDSALIFTLSWERSYLARTRIKEITGIAIR